MNMRKLFSLLFAAFSMAVATAQFAHPYVHGDILTMMRSDGQVVNLQDDFQQTFGTPLVHRAELFPAMRIQHFSYDHQNLNDAEVLRWFKTHAAVQKVQLNYLIQEREVPNDPLLGNQWHHVNANDKDIDSDLAWDITTGGLTASGDEIVVCVVEGGGSQYQHVDLIGNHWTNTNETAGNGLDDDANGYVDDFNGWNASGNNGTIAGGGHGTSVSGMIGAKGNNNIGISGVNWDVKIMQVMVGGLTQANVIAAYNYPYTMRQLYEETAGDRGAFVVAVNSSWGIDNANPTNFPLWCAMYDTMGEVGILNCGATANNNVNIDAVGDMPTACPSDYMISVTATNNNDQRTFSGYGITTVDLGAPGGNVYLTSNNNGYGNTTGTSFASPCVAGAVALMYSAPCASLAALAHADPQAAADLVRDAIYDGVDQTTQLLTETTTGGRLNVHNSLLIIMDNCQEGSCFVPAQVNINPAGNNVTVNWNGLGTVEYFEIEYRPIGEPEWSLITSIIGPNFTFDFLDLCAQYELHIRAACAEGEFSDWTNDFVFTTDGCCEAPASVQLSVNTESLTINWTSVFAADQYIVHISTDTEDFSFADLTDNSYEFSPVTECTEYTVIIETLCNGAKDLVTGPVSITSPGCGACNDLEYCAALSGSTEDEWLQSVVIGGFSNVSGNNDGYGDFTDSAIPMQTAVPYNVTLTPGFGGFTFNEFYQIWIDLNHDGTFSTSEKLVSSVQASNQIFNGTLNIPFVGSLPGIARMRITMSYVGGSSTVAQPCGDYDYGETEDYCVDLTVAPGISEQDQTVQFDLFPNPASDQVTVIQNGGLGQSTLVITDLTGQTVALHNVKGLMQTIDLTALTAGAYFVRLTDSDGRALATRRLVVD